MLALAAAVPALAACSAGGGGSGSGTDGAGGGAGRGATSAEAVLGGCVAAQVAAALGTTLAGLDDPFSEDDVDRAVLRIARDVCELREVAAGGETAGGAGSAAAAGTGGAGNRAGGSASPEADRDAALPPLLVGAPARLDPTDPAPGTDPALDELWAECADGEAMSCDRLLYESPPDSDYEAFGFSCGGRENLHCATLLGAAASLDGDVSPSTPAPGADAELDRWWAQCAGGSSRACSQLVLTAPGASLYAYYGYSCGGRTAGDCAALLGDDGGPPALAGRSPDDAAPGTDAYLDRLWGLCSRMSATACGDLATFGPPGSAYERFALSCGWRAVTPCTRLFARLGA
ncbi:MAG TPA: hypothetical protein DEP66_03540 [Acidimicrobiaceae bacterium]|nr:hypothetical protein [Acidimicrobiaceae bacterium]